MSEQPIRSGLYYVIPAEIMDHDDLSPREKLLYVLLSGFADSKGECYPSNEYLGKRLKIRGDEVGKLVGNLEKLGFISKVTIPNPRNPFKKIRIITVLLNFKKSLPIGKNPYPEDGKNPALDTGKIPSIVSEEDIVSEDNTPLPPKVENESKFLKPKKRQKVEPELLIQRKDRIATTEREHQKLIQIHGTEEIVDALYEEVSLWKFNKGIEGGRDYPTLNRWGVNNANKTLGINQNDKKAGQKTSELLAKKVEETYKSNENIVFGYDYIEFSKGYHSPPVIVKFADHGFREQVITNLRKMNLPIEGL